MKPETHVIKPGVCPVCSGQHNGGSYTGSEAKTAIELGSCWNCGFWENRARGKNDVVIDGYTYSIGPENSTSKFRGMAGRKFIIEFLDGRTVTTTNLWAGGEVPKYFRSRIPNTAKFSGGAERSNVGGITCWNASK